MNLTSQQDRVIDRWLSAVETGKPGGDYGNVTLLHDNPQGGLQITYGKHQTTEAGRRAQKLVDDYLEKSGKNSPVLKRFVEAPTYSMVGNKELLRALRQAGEDPVMQEVQNEFFVVHYMNRAFKWATSNGFTEALSFLCIYDSYIQSNHIPSWIRRRFREVPPAKGGDERRWVEQYVNSRHQWLKHWGNGRDKKSQAIRNSRYRTRGLIALIEGGNWKLNRAPIYVNGIQVI